MKENGLVLTGDWRPKERQEQGKKIANAIEKAKENGLSPGWIVRIAVAEWLGKCGYLTATEKGKKP